MNSNFTVFNPNDALHIVEKLKGFYKGEEVDNWYGMAISNINEIFKKYCVKHYEINKNSYMGIVLDCTTDNKNIYIKIVPPMIDRFNNEVETLKKLPREVKCSIIEIIYSMNAIIMDKIEPGNVAEFSKNEGEYEILFETLYNNRILITEKDKNIFKDFSEVVTHDFEILKKYNLITDIVEKMYNVFLKKYEEIEGEEYLLHGDVYKNNALNSKNGIKLIDPLGFKAPFVFELLPICAYEMFYSDKNYASILNEFSTYFEKYVSKDIYEKALFCQLVKVYIPSIFEANDGGVRAEKWLNIISTLYSKYL